MIDEPSESPEKVPAMEAPCRMLKALEVPVQEPLPMSLNDKVAEPKVTAPDDVSRSNVPPVLLSLSETVAPVVSSVLPKVSVPMELELVPAARMPPLAIVVAPLIVPVPCKVAPEATLTALPEARLPVTKRVPALIAVAPV